MFTLKSVSVICFAKILMEINNHIKNYLKYEFFCKHSQRKENVITLVWKGSITGIKT